MDDRDDPPRDPDAPLTFTRTEILGGAARAWVLFVLLLLACVGTGSLLEMRSIDPGTAISAAYYIGATLGWTVLIGGGVSLLVMLTGMPLAWLCARALRRSRSVAFHVAAWAVFGALVGPSVLLVIGLLTGDFFLLTSVYLPLSALLTAVSVLYGWWRASRHARRALPRPEPRSPIGLDRAFADD